MGLFVARPFAGAQTARLHQVLHPCPPESLLDERFPSGQYIEVDAVLLDPSSHEKPAEAGVSLSDACAGGAVGCGDVDVVAELVVSIRASSFPRGQGQEPGETA